MNRHGAHTRFLNLASTILRPGLAAVAAFGLCQCAGPTPKSPADVVVSVKEQKLAIYNRGGAVSKEYPVSTSKFGLGDKPGTYGTPLGVHEVVAKIGHGAPAGAVFKSRHWTGEIIKPDSPGRDPIVSRIMWLRGMEKTNKNAYARCIYIHGTAEERNVGKPVSYGCIRMRSRDVIDLFGRLPIGSRVLVTEAALPSHVPVLPVAVPVKPASTTEPPIFLKPPDELAQRPIEKKSEDPSLVADVTAEPASESDGRWQFLAKLKRQPKPEMESEPAPVNRPRPRPEATPEPAPEPETVALQSTPTLPPAPKKLPGGGAVLYSAPTGSSGPGLVLKSKRSASQGYQN